nr:MAG: nonstructural protein [Microvirus sp.]
MDRIPKDMHESTHNNLTKTHELFCLKDTEANGYGLPQPALNTAMFIRELSNTFRNPDHPITKWPDKFEIYQCGTYNYNYGVVASIEPRFVGRVSDFRDVLERKPQ